MKKVIGALALLIVAAFSSCKKDIVGPVASENNAQQKLTGTHTIDIKDTSNSALGIDSLNNVKGIVRLQLAKDSINTDNILFNFDPNSNLAYTPGFDAMATPGFGTVSLSSYCSNNIPLAIYTLPLIASGTKIRLYVNAVSGGTFSMNLTAIQSIPQAYDVWLMDHYKADSVNLRINHSYAFNIIKTDTSSFGAYRFKLVFRAH